MSNPLTQRAASLRNGQGAAAPPPAYQPAPAARIRLEKPIPGHHGDIAEIVLRAPTFGDYIDCGQIMRRVISDDPDRPGKLRIEPIEDQKSLMAWVSTLSGIGETQLRLMSWTDARRLAAEVMKIVQAADEGNSPAGPTT